MRVTPAEQQMRDREVLRANKDLAAYFRGDRTEREARAALKIIKAFVRDRERRDAGSRPPLPGAQTARPNTPRKRRAAATEETLQTKSRRASAKKKKKKKSTRADDVSVDAPAATGFGSSVEPTEPTAE
jgi:hypothetical protein